MNVVVESVQVAVEALDDLPSSGGRERRGINSSVILERPAAGRWGYIGRHKFSSDVAHGAGRLALVAEADTIRLTQEDA